MTFLNEGLEYGFPNSGRVQCPDLEFLKRLASHKVPLSEADAWIDHLGSCSDCFGDFNRLRRGVKEQHRRRLALCGAVACVVLLSVGILWIRTARRGEASKAFGVAPIHQAEETVERTQGRELASVTVDRKPIQATLDITASHARGGEIAASGHFIRVSAQRLLCHLKLPLGSAAGRYYVRVQHVAQRDAIATAQGNASIKGGDVRLDVELDLSNVAAGEYLLSYRHAGGSWHYARILITS